MEVMTLWIKGLSVSFRRPLDHNYQRTFPLPPPTTIYGLIGAAIGLSDKDMWREESLIKKVKISVLSLKKPGFAKDMWSIKKIKNKRLAGSSPYFREILFYPEFLLIFGGERNVLSALKNAFLNPVFALSLGREDELIRIEDVEFVETENGEPIFSGTILPVDLRRARYKPIIEEGIKIEPPVMELIPLEFKMDKKGDRTPGNKKVYSFIPYGLTIKLEEDIGEIHSIGGRNFVWLNS